MARCGSQRESSTPARTASKSRQRFCTSRRISSLACAIRQVLWIHGGPEEAKICFVSIPWAQYLTQQGYLVLEPNYRGSTEVTANSFATSTSKTAVRGEMDDVAAAAQYLIDKGLADPKTHFWPSAVVATAARWSRMLMTKYPALFQETAIEMYGVVDRATFVELHESENPSAIRWMMKMGGSPAEKPDVYRRTNALLEVAKIRKRRCSSCTARISIRKVPPYESAQFVKALREHRKVFLLLHLSQ